MWVCNGPVSIINMYLRKNLGDAPSWVEGLIDLIQGDIDIKLAYCFPQIKKKDLIKEEINGIIFYGFNVKKNTPHIYCQKTEDLFRFIINDFKPDILHVFGTEFPYSLSAILAFNNPGKTLINIQGLSHIIAKHYYSGLPRRIVNMYTFRDVLRNDNIRKQAEKFKARGKFEIKAVKSTSHVIGRTDFDKACCLALNSQVRYHFCNETLRTPFYNFAWNINDCEKHTIFFSQCYYPIKGFHIMLEALAELKKYYPDVHLSVAGINIAWDKSFKSRLKISSYGKYIGNLITKFGLEKNITFLGQLNEEQMCNQYLRAHVFVSASSIENSPNSVGEAMLLGVPVVCSDVGGVKNLITHNQDGFVYPWDAPYMLAYYVKEIFSRDELALSFSNSSRNHASLIYSRENNIGKLVSIYEDLLYEKI